MKKLYAFVLLFSTAALAQAQTTIDTVDVYYARATGATLSSTGIGYIFGTGYYDAGGGTIVRLSDKVAQHFSAVSAGTANITEVLVGFGAKSIYQTPDSITVGIYHTGADSMPTTAIGTTRFSVSDMQPSGVSPVLTSIPFANPPAVTGDFAVVFDYTAVDDTFGILNSANGDGYGEQRTRMYIAGLGWLRLGQILSTGTDVDLFVVPVATFATPAGISQPIATPDFSVSLFPTPATDHVTLSLDMKTQNDVTVNVFDLSAKSFYHATETLHAGANNLDIDVTNLPAGNYYVTTSTPTASCTGKFSVVK